MKHSLLIQLDCVLDTRLAVLGSYDPSVPKRILATDASVKKYRGRLVDDWSEYGIPREKFKELWAKRDVNHLRASQITPFTFELTDIVEQIYDQFRAAPHTISDFDLVFNYYPYTDLTEGEIEALTDAIRVRLKTPTIIRWICEPLDVISPVYWNNNNIATAVIYDFEDWLIAHFGEGQEENIPNYEMPRNSIYAPALFTSLEKLRETADFQNPDGRSSDPLESIQFWFKPYFHLEYLGVEHFCIIDPALFVAMELHNHAITNEQ